MKTFKRTLFVFLCAAVFAAVIGAGVPALADDYVSFTIEEGYLGDITIYLKMEGFDDANDEGRAFYYEGGYADYNWDPRHNVGDTVPANFAYLKKITAETTSIKGDSRSDSSELSWENGVYSQTPFGSGVRYRVYELDENRKVLKMWELIGNDMNPQVKIPPKTPTLTTANRQGGVLLRADYLTVTSNRYYFELKAAPYTPAYNVGDTAVKSNLTQLKHEDSYEEKYGDPGTDMTMYMYEIAPDNKVLARIELTAKTQADFTPYDAVYKCGDKITSVHAAVANPESVIAAINKKIKELADAGELGVHTGVYFERQNPSYVPGSTGSTKDFEAFLPDKWIAGRFYLKTGTVTVSNVTPGYNEPQIKFTADAPYSGAPANSIIVNTTTSDGATINLTTETIDLAGFTVAAYSIDGGTKWKKGPLPAGEKFKKMLNKPMTLWLSDTWKDKAVKADPDKNIEAVAKGVPDNARIAKFPALEKRPKKNEEKLKPYYGDTHWVLAQKDSAEAVFSGYEYAPSSNGKTPTGNWEAVPSSGFGIVSGATKLTYLFRTAPNSTTPASAPFKIKPANFGKAPAYKIKDTKDPADKTIIIKVIAFKKGDQYAVGSEGYTPALEDKLTLTVAELAERGANLNVRKAATGKKPPSDAQSIALK
ncbi:MAG: hypothetical protein FWG36_01295 [Oscillospiraceae bacterium]|nr:hypothetical protein [Oscillospiraceae bacterium]